MRLHEFTNNNSPDNTLTRGNFWEHWFDTQSPLTRQTENRSEEHRIWEQAIHIGVLAAQQEEF